MTSTKIIYFTTKCNLDCRYCYEKDERKRHGDKTLSYEDIDVIVEDIAKNKDKYTCLVVFGGEVTTVYDKFEYFVNKLKEKNIHIAINVETNGVKLSDPTFAKKFVSLLRSYGPFSIDISYDGIYHDEQRCFPNGQGSKLLVEKALRNLMEMNVPFRIRYSLHKQAIENLDQTIKDIIRIILLYKPERVVLNRIYSDFENRDILDHNEVLENYCKSIYRQLKVPICEYVCDECNLCNKTPYLEYTGSSNKKRIKISGEVTEFDDFTRLF